MNVTASQLVACIEPLIQSDQYPIDEPATWCTCDECLSLDRKLRGAKPSALLGEPLVMLNLSPGVLTRRSLTHFLPALMLAALCHPFGSDDLRRGLALELMTQASLVEALNDEGRRVAASFLRWAASVEEERGLYAGDYVEAAVRLESTGSLETSASYAVTW